MCVASLSGCALEHPAQAMFSDYRDRLANVTLISTDFLADTAGPMMPLAALPRRRDRSLPLSDIRIGVWEYLQLYECELNQLVSERNSSLGKVMPASQRLVYESRLVYEIPQCLASLRRDDNPDSELIAELQQALETKRQELPRAAWNAMLGSQEFESLASLASAPVEPANATPLIISRQALAELLRIGLAAEQSRTGAGTQFGIDTDTLEDALHSIQTQQGIGRLMQSLKLVSAELWAATQILRQAREQNTLCPGGNRTVQADYLQNVLSKYYVGRVQPYLSLLDREGQELLEAVDQLLNLYRAEMPPSFNAYYMTNISLQSQSGAWQHFQTVVKDHVIAWQGLLANCNMQPKAS